MKNKIILITSQLIFISQIIFAQSSNSIEATLLLKEMITKKRIVGLAAGYSINSKTQWNESAGYSDSKQKKTFTDSTLTRVASIAKPMTAIAIMQLVEQQLIDLDKPIQTYLPDFPQKTKKSITVRQLLSHTSGINQYQSEKEIENQIEFLSLREAMIFFQDRDLRFEPGTDYFYTTYGYVVLGRIIEKVTGQRFEVYMQENIWRPAGMINTGIEKYKEEYSHKSCLYHKRGKNAKKAKQNNLSNRVPGGGFYSTLKDMLKFGEAVLEHKLIKENTLELMFQNQFEGKKGNPYGLGWIFYGPPPYESYVIGHSGEQTGAATQLMLIPKSKTVVVVLANTSGTWKDVVTFASNLISISEQKE